MNDAPQPHLPDRSASQNTDGRQNQAFSAAHFREAMGPGYQVATFTDQAQLSRRALAPCHVPIRPRPIQRRTPIGKPPTRKIKTTQPVWWLRLKGATWSTARPA